MIRFLTKAAEEEARTALFTADGKWAQVLEDDEGTVLYRVNGWGKDLIGEMGRNLFRLGQLDLEATFTALGHWGGGRHKDVGVGITFCKHTFVKFDGRLCVRFYKQRGSVPHELPVTEEQMLAIKDGRGKLVYFKGSNRYDVKVQNA